MGGGVAGALNAGDERFLVGEAPVAGRRVAVEAVLDDPVVFEGCVVDVEYPAVVGASGCVQLGGGHAEGATFAVFGAWGSTADDGDGVFLVGLVDLDDFAAVPVVD